MSKKDRIAIVFSVLIIFFIILAFASGDEQAASFMFIVIAYWGFRFIKDDISFLNKKQ